MEQRTGMPSVESCADRASISVVLIAVAVLALLINTASILASPLWVYPDSVDYIQLAGGIADRMDFGNELFLIRPPVYPLMLAGIFTLFGQNSPIVIQVVQHGMVVAVAMLTVLIAWHITGRRTVAFLAGLMCTGSLQLISYANMPLAEVPFTLALIACVYFLVRYTRSGSWRLLVLASFMTGIACLIKPIGQHLIGVCILAILLRMWREKRPSRSGGQPNQSADEQDRDRWQEAVRQDCDGSGRVAPVFRLVGRLAVGLVLAVVPAMALTTSWTVSNRLAHPSSPVNRCLDYVLYLGLVTNQGLDSTDSAALAEIRQVVDEAVRQGHLPADADFRDRGTIIKAYELVRNAPFAESSMMMGRAGRDVLNDNFWPAAVGAVKYAGWMVMSPDPVYRFQPGGTVSGDGKRTAGAVLFDIGTYGFGPGSWEHELRPYRHYVPLTTEPRMLSAHSSSLALWFHNHIDQGAPLVGVGDSAYEEMMLVCIVACALTLLTRARQEWLVVATTIGFQIGVSAFLAGAQVRYATPVRALLMMCAAFLLVTMVRAVIRVGLLSRNPRRVVPVGHPAMR